MKMNKLRLWSHLDRESGFLEAGLKDESHDYHVHGCPGGDIGGESGGIPRNLIPMLQRELRRIANGGKPIPYKDE